MIKCNVTYVTEESIGVMIYFSINLEPTNLLLIIFLVSCPAGTYKDSSMVECKQCPPNTYSTESSGLCTACPQGSQANKDRTQCGKSVALLSYSKLYNAFCRYARTMVLAGRCRPYDVN